MPATQDLPLKPTHAAPRRTGLILYALLTACVIVGVWQSGDEQHSSRHEAGGRALQATYSQGDAIKFQWDGNPIGLAVLVGWWGAYAGLTSSATNFAVDTENRFWYCVLLMQSGFSLGVCTMWAVYYIGMQAIRLHSNPDPLSPPMPLRFDPTLTVLSALWTWLASSLSFHLLMPSTESIDRRAINRFTIKRVLLAMSILVLSLCGLHFASLASQAGSFQLVPNVGHGIGASVLAVLLSVSALAVIFYSPHSTIVRIVAAVVITVAINALLYSALAVLEYRYHEPSADASKAWTMIPRELTISILTLDLIVVSLASFYSERVSKYVSGKAEELEQFLRHKKYQKDSRRLIRHARAMRFPMCLVPYDTFVKAGKLVVHETLRDKGKLIYVDSSRSARKIRKSGLIIFFSHQWLSHTAPDPSNTQFHDMVLSVRSLIKSSRVKPESVYIWVDYSSVPQEAHDQQQLAIESLPTYVSSCSAFIIIAPQVMHSNDGIPCNFTTYSRRLWCRLEVFCMILATMYMWRETKVGVVKEESHEDDEGRLLKAVPTTSGADMNNSNTQVFFFLQDALVPVSFWDKDGRMQECYEHLLYIYEGDCTCCIAGHPLRDGEDVICDKLRLVTMLTGIYGLMLVELQKTNQGNRLGSSAHAASRAFAAQIVKERNRIFPTQYFETRIEAMSEQVDSWKKTLAGIIEGDEGERVPGGKADAEDEAAEAMGEDDSQANTSESESKSSKGSGRKLGGEDESGSDLEQAQGAQPTQSLGPGAAAAASKRDASAREDHMAIDVQPTRTQPLPKDEGTGVSQILFSVGDGQTDQKEPVRPLLAASSSTSTAKPAKSKSAKT